MRDPLRVVRRPELRHPTLVVGWSGDICEVGTRVTGYLNKRLGGQGFCEIDPADFFPLSGVAIENNLIQFPESKFYACPDRDLALFISPSPVFEWYDFLNLVLDIAERDCHVREIYTIGGMMFLGAHTMPRRLLGVFSSEEHKDTLSRYNIGGNWDYETSPGQRPTLSSFLLWMARKRGITATNLWVPIPFYLATADDPKARKMVLEFLDQRLNLRIDFSDLDEEIVSQNRRLARFRTRFPEIDGSLKRLESNMSLSEEESRRLVIEVERFLSGEDG